MKFFTPEEDAFLWANYLTIPIKTMGKMIGRCEGSVTGRCKRIGIVVPPEIIAQRVPDSRLKPGHVPPNKGRKQTEYMSSEQIARTAKTRFKKGQLPPNTYQEDFITVTRMDKRKKPQVFVRLAAGKWDYLSRAIWQHFNGPIPKGGCIAFIDGDTENVIIENLKLITMAENMERNSAQVNLTDGYIANTLAWRDKETADFIREKAPELIKAKRTSLLINRKLKSIQNGTKQNDRSK